MLTRPALRALQVPRIGPQHQAGSDSLLTAATFFKMRGKFFEDAIDSKMMGVLYGLNSASAPAPTNVTHGATHFPLPQGATPGGGVTPAVTPAPTPLGNAASAAIAILSPSPRASPARRG